MRIARTSAPLIAVNKKVASGLRSAKRPLRLVPMIEPIPKPTKTSGTRPRPMPARSVSSGEMKLKVAMPPPVHMTVALSARRRRSPARGSTMDARRLMVFRAVAHELSFSRAAETLSLSQPSVSHQVALLETEIGVRVFDRDRGRAGLRLTHAGQILLEHADHIGWRLQLADAQLSRMATAHREEVRLGAFPTALAGYVPSAIKRLRAADSGLRVILSEVTPSTLEPRFFSGEFDVALGYQDATTARRELQSAERIDLFQDTFLIGMPPQHRLAGSTHPVALSEFADDDWIVPSTDGFLTKACRDAGFDPRIVSPPRDPVATRGSSRAASASDGYRAS